MAPNVTREQSQAYYEDFSLAVGERDWIRPNLRHEQLKLLIGHLVAGRKGLRIADVGCGAGVMTDFLTRYGNVVGVDFSTAAIAAAKRCAPEPTFTAGGLDALSGGPYDLITLFDVLEHIPLVERPRLLVQLREKLACGGLLFCSTPFPTATRGKRAAGDPALQIIDEEVELPAVLNEADAAGLQLIRFEAYDVFNGSPEYQAMVFTPIRTWGDGPVLRPPRLTRQKHLISSKVVQHARRVRFALRCLSHGDVRTALWFLRGRHRSVQS